VEVGPGETLSRIARRVSARIPVYTLGEDEEPPDFLQVTAPLEEHARSAERVR
jgi:hypothetical protein